MIWRMARTHGELQAMIWLRCFRSEKNAECRAGALHCRRITSTAHVNRDQKYPIKGKGGQFKPLEYRYEDYLVLISI